MPPMPPHSSFFGDRELALVFRAGLNVIVKAIKEHGVRTPMELAIYRGLKMIVVGIERRWNIKTKR